MPRGVPRYGDPRYYSNRDSRNRGALTVIGTLLDQGGRTGTYIYRDMEPVRCLLHYQSREISSHSIGVVVVVLVGAVMVVVTEVVGEAVLVKVAVVVIVVV